MEYDKSTRRFGRSEAMHRLPEDRRIYLQPGEHRAVEGPFILSTLLGSCIAACLYDPASEVAGMNHFLLANRRYAMAMPTTITEAGRYGINAMELLINAMLKLGAAKDRLRAKVFGGSIFTPTDDDRKFFCVGEVNRRFIIEFLNLERIPIDAEDTGGVHGRVIHFHTDSYKVYRRYITNRNVDEQIVSEEKDVWRRGIEESGKEGDAILFV